VRNLRKLLHDDYSEDRDCQVGTPAYRALRHRDGRRRSQVLEVLKSRKSFEAVDLYAAAWILNHGDTHEEAAKAHELAMRAAELGHREAKWLAAAALDRSLMYLGQPQKYGTNIVPDGVGYRLWDVDPNTTDRERSSWDVPALAEMQRRASEQAAPQPPMDTAPVWLRNAIERWKASEDCALGRAEPGSSASRCGGS